MRHRQLVATLLLYSFGFDTVAFGVVRPAARPPAPASSATTPAVSPVRDMPAAPVPAPDAAAPELAPLFLPPPPPPPPNGSCDLDAQGEVVVARVEQSTSVDFNVDPPACAGDPDLCGAFSYDKSGATPETWKAIFDVGGKKLEIAPGATLSVVNVPATSNNQKAPGLEIRSSCGLLVEAGASISVGSLNQPAGDIFIQVDGDVRIEGTVRNSVSGTNGTPGKITIASCLGNLETGPQSRIETLGVDHGGRDVNLLTCAGGGDIAVNGLVRAVNKYSTTPNVNVVAFGGSVTIDGRNDFGEEVENGTTIRRSSGLLSRTTHATLAGKVRVQAKHDVTVLGNRILNANRTQYGAIAVKPHSTNGQGGDGDLIVRALEGSIVASDRAFDFANRFNSQNAISLEAKNDVALSVTAAVSDGAANNAKAVVSSQGLTSGQGGANTLRSFSGQVTIGPNAQVLANYAGSPGTNGTNSVTSCNGVINSGTVTPADANPADDSGTCTPAAPAALFANCEEFGVFPPSGPQNQPPSVNAGADQSITLPAGAVLDATVTDDGLPAGGSLTVLWSKLSGPGGVNFGSASATTTTATFSQAGTYELRLTASDGELSRSDDVTVFVAAANQAPSVDAGPDQTITLPSNAVTLNGIVSDDGLPAGSSLTIAWSVTSGPGSVVFGSPSAAVTTATFGAAGSYELLLSATDGALSSSDPVLVTVLPSQLPTVSIAAATVAEGHGGATLASVSVSLSAASAVQVTVDYTTSDGTASACDYAPRFGTLSFAPGVVTRTIEVPVFGDLLPESSETVLVLIGNPSQATLGDDSATLSISDDDAANAAPSAPSNLQPPDGRSDVVFTPTLSWSSSDPDAGDAAVHDVFFGTQFGLDGQAWSRQCGATAGPSLRSAAATAYDDVRDRLMVFGGRSPAGASLSDVWVLENASGAGGAPRWTSLSTSGSGPSARRAASAVYDAANNRLIVHGGCDGACDAPFADTWALTNANGTGGTPEWLSLLAAPLGRAAHAAAWDATHGAMLVFGGSNGFSDRDDVWVLRDASGASPVWEERPTGVRPAARQDSAAAYDAAFDRLIVFGGRVSPDTPLQDAWVLQQAATGTAQWLEITPEIAGPPARYGHAAGYDPASKRLIVFGGTNAGLAANLNFVMSDAWLLTHADGETESEWVRIEPGTDVPAGRFSASTGYSAAINRFVVALGRNDKPGAPALDDLWSLHGAAGSLPLASDGQAAATFAPGTLTAGTTYYWKVLAEDGHGAQAASPVSRFTANHPLVSVASASTAEGDAGTTPLAFAVTLSRASDVETRVDYQAVSGSAVSGEDFAPASGTLVFPANTATASVTVNVTGDVLYEPDETFTLVLSNPQGLVAGAPATGTIENDDPVPNMAPVVDAGPDQQIALPTSATLAGSVTDDGLPVGASVSVTWSKVSGPGGVTFTNTAAASTVATFGAAGTYVLRLSASDTLLTGADEVQVVVAPAPNLTAGNVDDTLLVVDGQTLAVSGTLAMTVSNPSPTAVGAPFTVTFFEDRNGDAQFQMGVDNVLATAQATGVAAGGSVGVQATASGSLLFPGNVLYGLADSGMQVAESSENDNLGSNAPCVTPPPAAWNVSLKWKFSPAAGFVGNQPAVADLDGDGQTEAVFIGASGGYLHVVRGSDGTPIFVVTDPNLSLNPLSHVAVGNIDGDQELEIVAYGAGATVSGRLAAFEHDGTLKWVGPANTGPGLAGGPALADLDGDGTPEIVSGNFAVNADGSLRAFQPFGGAANGGDGPHTIVADLDMDGSPEVLVGNVAFHVSATGFTTYWDRKNTISQAFDAVGNFDADPFPEVVLAANGTLWMLEHDGVTKWGPVPVNGRPAGPAVADLDGDGVPEIAVSGRDFIQVFRANGTLLWEAPTQDITSSGTFPTAFDFDGDGAAELVHTDEVMLRIFRGSDGLVLFETPIGSGTRLEEPAIADVDGDGHADVLVAGNTDAQRFGVLVFSAPEWVGARRIWNQHTYHVTNVNDDGTIPAHEAPSWATAPFGYRQQSVVPRAPGCVHALPDLVASHVVISAAGGERIVTARIGNGGNAPALLQTPVSFYDGDPRTGGQRIGFLSTSAPLLAGQFQDVELHLPASLSTTGSVFVVADDVGELVGRIAESDESNNLYDSGQALVASPGQPDLAPASIDTSGVISGPQGLAIAGTLSAVVRNQGDADAATSFGVTFFEDLDRNDALSAGDGILATAQVAGLAAGASAVVSAPASGTLLFRDAPVHVFVDSGAQVAESEEQNNVLRSGAACLAQPESGLFAARVEWSWTGSPNLPASTQPSGLPVVADLDGDGTPEVAFVTNASGAGGQVLGNLRAVRGTDGSEVFTVSSPQVWAGGSLAVGNIDADPELEIIAFSEPPFASSRLAAFEHTGALKWQSSVVVFVSQGGPTLIPDLDGDGRPEVAVGNKVYRGSNGTVFRAAASGGGVGGIVPAPIAVDLDLDGVPELVAGNTAYRTTGPAGQLPVYWQILSPLVGEPNTAVGNFDSDPNPEIVAVSGARLHLLEHDGTIKWGPVNLPGGGGVPVVADFDGDGQVDFAVGSADSFEAQVTMVDGRGFARWKVVRGGQVAPSLMSVSAFDFDGDGIPEVVWADKLAVRILRGYDGLVLSELALPRVASASYPIVADVDADGNAEIVTYASGAPGTQGLYVLGAQNDGWVGARKIWNQNAYNVTNVNDDGTIPAQPVWDPLNFNSFRRSGLATGFPLAAPDLTASYARLQPSGSNLVLTVRVGNAGAGVAAAGIPVSFWDGTPGGTLLGTAATTQQLDPGEYQDVSFTFAGDAASLANIQVRVDESGSPSGPNFECREANNVLDTGFKLNQAPQVDVGADQAISLPQDTVTLPGVVSDDGLPLAGSVTQSWTVLSGPGTVTFGDATSATTTATFVTPGTYFLRLTATDTRLTAFDDVQVILTPPNQAPQVNAGADQTITRPPQTSVTLAGTATDDGLPFGSTVTVEWSQVSGPAAVSFSNATSLSTTATFAIHGTYVLRLTATDGALSAFDDVTITVIQGNTPPQVSAGADQTITLPASSATLAGSATDDGLPAATLTVSWSQVNGPGQTTFTTPSATTTSASFDAPGTYTLRLTASDGALQASDDVVVTVNAGPPVGPPPVVELTTPTEGQAVTEPTAVTGSVTSASLLSWKLQVRKAGDATFTTIQTGTTETTGTIATFDPTLHLNGQFELLLRATDTAGRTAADSKTVVVKDNLKVGNFTLSFTDMEVPVAGLPIRVTRTYDSRDRNSVGDFGNGWRLDVSNVKVQENGTAGLLWTGTKSPGFLQTYCLEPIKPVIVSVTTPDGRVYEFEPELSPQCTSGAPIQVTSYGFRPRPGTTTLGTLQVVGDNRVIPSGSWPGPMQLYGESDYQLFDPDDYLLTLPDGRQLTLNQQRGLVSIRDLSGNVLNVNANGITYQNPDVPGSAKGIVFARDGQGRITAVTDPDGNSLTYGYDANGDLASVKDREENETTITYVAAQPHLLDEIHDPLGRTPLKNEYDTSGRLVAHTDAFGQRIEYTHNIGTRQEVVKDRNDKIRVLEYDSRGNVVKETLPDGRQILRTFDARNNRTSETEPHDPTNTTPPTTIFEYDGSDNVTLVRDPLGNEMRMTYNARRQVLTTTDARNKMTTNTFDSKGNLLSIQDASGSVTSQTYDAKGNVKTRTVTVNGVSQTTSYDYDSFGNLTKETDAQGHEMVFTYNSKGNRLSETTTRTAPSGVETLTRTLEYDKNGRLTKAIDADGTFIRTVYDALGRRLESYDMLGRKTSFEYDELGRLKKTTYADLTFEERTFDNENRPLTVKDRRGLVTSFEYDDRGRLKKTILPDLFFTENFYDAAGRLTSTKDVRGKMTTFEYDAAGRRTKVKDPLNNETVFTHDPNGNQKTVRDARLNTTTFDYDDLNRRTKATFPDTTFTLTGYDELSRRTSEQDQAGRVTQFQYDKLGRLVKVIDPLLQETVYGYDEVGSRVLQRDARTKETRFEYDKLGRETKRILPDGSFETKQYDAAGNLKVHVDFNGKTTSFDYDTNNRVTLRTYHDGSTASFTYTPTGRLETMTDSRGVTSYGYDVRDRMTSVIYPDGRKLEYTWDPNGNRGTLTVVLADGTRKTTSFTHDDAGRLDLVTDPNAGVYDHGYDASGNRTSLSHPNGTLTSYVYDALNRLTNLATTRPASGTTIQGYVLTLGANGHREQIVEHDGTTRGYGYDTLDRLTRETVTDALGLIYEKTWTYDAVGNRLTQATTGQGAGSQSYTVDDRDRLLTANATNYSYDANGSLTAKSGEATYTWSLDHRLTRVTKTDGTIVEHVYDPFGNRVRTTTTSPGGAVDVVDYLVDTSGSLSHVAAETDGVTGALRALYVRGDDLLAVIRPSETKYVHADALGSIRRLTDAAGNVSDGYSYDAFGVELAHTGTDPQPYRFAGEPLDPNSGFYYNRARWLDAATGRFVSLDSWPGSVFDPPSLHRYLYAHADPVNNVDPSGAYTVGQLLVVGAIIGALSAIAIVQPRTVLGTVVVALGGAAAGAALAAVAIAWATGASLSAVATAATGGAVGGVTLIQGELQVLAPQAERIWLGHYGGNAFLYQGRWISGLQAGLNWLTRMADQFKGVVLDELPRDINVIKPVIDGARHIVFNISNLQVGSLTWQEFQYIMSRPDLVEKTTFVTGVVR